MSLQRFLEDVLSFFRERARALGDNNLRRRKCGLERTPVREEPDETGIADRWEGVM